MSLTPPTDSQYGFVVCQIIRRIADATDSDDFPDAVAASGNVLFKPQVQVSKVSAPSAFAVQETVTVTLDDQGRITSPGNSSLFGVWLLAGVYSVTFQLNNATLPSLTIEVTTDHTPTAPLDLVTAGSYTPPSGVTVQTLIIPSTIAAGQVLMLDDTRTLVGVPYGGGGSSSWSAITGKPAVIAAGESAVEARAVIGAVSVEDLPDVSGLATTASLTAGLAGKQDAGDYATTASLSTVATTGAYADLTGKPTIPVTPDLSGFATTAALTEGLAGKQPVGDYALVSQLPDVSGFATTTALTSGLAGKQDAGDYATTTALTSGLAGKQDVGDYATRAELPDVSGLATTAYVDQTVGDIDTVLSGILGGE